MNKTIAFFLLLITSVPVSHSSELARFSRGARLCAFLQRCTERLGVRNQVFATPEEYERAMLEGKLAFGWGDLPLFSVETMAVYAPEYALQILYNRAFDSADMRALLGDALADDAKNEPSILVADILPVFQSLQDARIDGYSAYSAVALSRNKTEEQKRVLIDTLARIGVQMTEKDRAIIEMDT